MNRLYQIVLILSTVAASWLGMQAVHEFGHVLGAWSTGGEIERVVLHPLTISRTDLGLNPRPLVVVWSGPMLGVALPLLMWGLSVAVRLQGAFVLRFFAGFCLVANGGYIALGSFDRIGDCGTLLQHGAAMWQLWLFGLLTVPAGFWMWHGQGTHFGFGTARGMVARSATYVSVATCMGLLILACVVDGR